MKNRHPESHLQRWCVSYINATHPDIAPLLFAIPNGGKRSAIEAAIMKGEGVRAGIPDLFLALPVNPHCGLFIEMKSPGGKLTKHQEGYIALLRFQGYRCEVCRSPDEFIEILEDYIKLLTT